MTQPAYGPPAPPVYGPPAPPTPEASGQGQTSEPVTWGQAIRNRLLGAQGQALDPQYQRQALISGLLQGAAALGGPGGARANWGSALLSGVAGLQQGVTGGQEMQRRDAYRKSIEDELAQTQDPTERMRLQWMLLNTDRYAPPATARGANPRYHFSTEAVDAEGKTEAKFLYTITPDGQVQRMQVGEAVRSRVPHQGELRPTYAQLIRASKIRGARERWRNMTPEERAGLQFDDPASYGLLLERAADEDEDDYNRWMFGEFMQRPEEPPEPPAEPGLFQSVFSPPRTMDADEQQSLMDQGLMPRDTPLPSRAIPTAEDLERRVDDEIVNRYSKQRR